MRSKTTLAHRLPDDIEDKVVEFHRFMLRARQHCGYESSQILNMDETPMRFELPAARTLEFIHRKPNSVYLILGRPKTEFCGHPSGEGKW